VTVSQIVRQVELNNLGIKSAVTGITTHHRMGN